MRHFRREVGAIEAAIDAQGDCGQAVHLIAGARGAMVGLILKSSRITCARIWSMPKGYPRGLDKCGRPNNSSTSSAVRTATQQASESECSEAAQRQSFGPFGAVA